MGYAKNAKYAKKIIIFWLIRVTSLCVGPHNITQSFISYMNAMNGQMKWNYSQSVSVSHTGRTTPGARCYNLAVACVLFLCVLLLTAATVLWIKFSILNTELDKLQTTYSTLITEQDQLQTSYKYLTIERNRLWTKTVQMSLERDHLKARNNNLTINREEQKATNENLVKEIQQLQNNYDELQNMLNTIGEKIL